jgi:very-short-patch-repair endonuclease
MSWQSLQAATAGVLERCSTAYKMEQMCESPIEIDLGARLLRTLSTAHLLVPQFRLQRFRYDFAIIRQLVLIECDGKQWHSTPEQLANDQRKDEAARKIGAPLLRFTGSEIFNDVNGCAERVLRELHRQQATQRSSA